MDGFKKKKTKQKKNCEVKSVFETLYFLPFGQLICNLWDERINMASAINKIISFHSKKGDFKSFLSVQNMDMHLV